MLHQHLTTEELASLFGMTDSPRQADVSLFDRSLDGRGVGDSVVSKGDGLQAEQRVLLRAVHERFARSLSIAWSALVRGHLEVRLINAECISPDAFLEKRESPGCAIALRSPDGDGPVVVNLPLRMLHLMIDRMLGGDPVKQVADPLPLTEIEHRLVGRIHDALITELQQTWGQVWEGELSIERVTEPSALDENLELNTPVMAFRFELQMGVFHGALDLCFSCRLLKAILAQCSGEMSAKRGVIERHQELHGPDADEDIVDLVVSLEAMEIHPRDVADLDIGDLIVTGHNVATALRVCVPGACDIGGTPGAMQGRKTLQVTAVSEPPMNPAENRSPGESE